MKKLFAISVVVFSLLVRPAGRVFAADEVAGQAGTLAYHFSEILVDERVIKLQAYLASYHSPLASDAKTFIEEADRYDLDWKLVAAIAGVESTFGQFIPPGSYNAWGWGIPTGHQDGIHFKDWSDGIAQVSRGLAYNYYGRGAKTIYEVGWRYAANGISWGNHVQYFVNQIDAFRPATPDSLPVSI